MPSGPWATTRRLRRWPARRGPSTTIFRQRFAQVTNPPIDSLREACVVSAAHAPRPVAAHARTRTRRCLASRCSSPFLSLGRWRRSTSASHRIGQRSAAGGARVRLLADRNAVGALDVSARSDRAGARRGAVLLLTDRRLRPRSFRCRWRWRRARCITRLIDAGVRTTRRTRRRSRRLPRPASRRGAARHGRGRGVSRGSRWRRRALPIRRRAKRTCCTPSTWAWRRSCRRWASPSSTAIAARISSTPSDCSDDVSRSLLAGTPAPLGGIGFAELGAAGSSRLAGYLPARAASRRRARGYGSAGLRLGALPQGRQG